MFSFLKSNAILTNGFFAANVFSIEVVGNDVYLAGFEYNGTSANNAKYWKNGTATILAAGPQANSMAVFGNDVYVAGNQPNPTTANSMAVYWKNGQAIPLTDGTTNAYAYAVVVWQ
jgi:hypothetical protein